MFRHCMYTEYMRSQAETLPVPRGLHKVLAATGKFNLMQMLPKISSTPTSTLSHTQLTAYAHTCIFSPYPLLRC